MTQPTVTKKKGFRLFSYFSEIINELKKVVWLKWPQEVMYLTGLVVIVTIIAGIVLGLLDFSFSELVSKVFLR
jgi:preprotein translocase SecE subunit